MADDDRPVLATSGNAQCAMPLAAMLRSVGAHLRSQCRVEVYILSDEMASRERKKVRLSVPETMRLHWVKPDLGLLKDAPVHGHVTIATYFRIIAPLVLPAEAGGPFIWMRMSSLKLIWLSFGTRQWRKCGHGGPGK